MTNVKWLSHIAAISEPFDGYQMRAYTYRQSGVDPAQRMTDLKVRALMVPPGIPDFFTRHCLVEAGDVLLEGRAWAGRDVFVTRVEVSVDDGKTWSAATLSPEPVGKFAWVHWTFLWRDAPTGDHTLQCRAFDSQGNEQDEDDIYNVYAMGCTTAQRVHVTVVHRKLLAPKFDSVGATSASRKASQTAPSHKL